MASQLLLFMSPLLYVFKFSLISLIFFVNWHVNGFDYFQMVLQWPPATCKGSNVPCRSAPPLMFTIHGFWPSYLSGAEVLCNSKAELKAKQLAPLQTLLERYWPDVIYGHNFVFWERQWKKHGRCSYSNFKQYQYFEAALNIRMNFNYDILAILNAAHLSPNANTLHSYSAVEGAIEAAIGKKPGLHCNANIRTGSHQLWEIILCFEKDALTLMDCPPYIRASCGRSFVFHDEL